MTTEQKYNELLTALAEIICAKNNDLVFKNYEISELKEKLSAAEQEIEELKFKEGV